MERYGGETDGRGRVRPRRVGRRLITTRDQLPPVAASGPRVQFVHETRKIRLHHYILSYLRTIRRTTHDTISNICTLLRFVRRWSGRPYSMSGAAHPQSLMLTSCPTCPSLIRMRPPARLAFLVVSFSLPRPSQPIIWSLNDKCLRTTADRSPPTSHHVYTVIGQVEKYVVEMKIKRKVSPWSSLITERT